MGTVPPKMQYKGFLAAAAYGVTSILITFFNKAVFALYDFKASNTLILGQMALALVFLFTLKASNTLEIADVNMKLVKAAAPLSITFCGMVISGVAALRFVNIPLYSALRRVTTWMVMAFQAAFLGQQTPKD